MAYDEDDNEEESGDYWQNAKGDTGGGSGPTGGSGTEGDPYVFTGSSSGEQSGMQPVVGGFGTWAGGDPGAFTSNPAFPGGSGTGIGGSPIGASTPGSGVNIGIKIPAAPPATPQPLGAAQGMTPTIRPPKIALIPMPSGVLKVEHRDPTQIAQQFGIHNHSGKRNSSKGFFTGTD